VVRVNLKTKLKHNEMRVIKFKAKTLDGKDWVYGDLSRSVIGGNVRYYLKILDAKKIEVNPDTVCQFTGLQDFNEKDIYECDKIAVMEGCNVYCNEYIICENGCFYIRDYTLIEFIGDRDYSYQITGNIHN
jgi:acetyltransferase-like isoleucine patch superfamily enzyme